MAFAWLAAALVVVSFGWLVWDVVRSGSTQLSWSYLTSEPIDSGRSGGIGTVLVSTLLVLAVCLSVALPLGIATAAWLAEYTAGHGRLARGIRISLDLLASIPSIVFGLFGMVFFSQFLGLGFSILAGGLTLACMILPIVVQTTHAGFRSAPAQLRSAAAALGFRRITTLWYLLLPAALHGVVVGIILGIGRALAETAALIFTSGYSSRMPESLLDSGRTLSVHIFDLSMNIAGGHSQAAAAALVLLGVLLGLNVIAQGLARHWLRGAA
jgi:phosphate transport system permease protein